MLVTKRVYVDFESRSQADIWTCGAYRYAEDPTTEILCLAWAVDNGHEVGARGRFRQDVLDAYGQALRAK